MLTIHMRPMLNHTLSLILEYNNIAQPFKNKDIRNRQKQRNIDITY